MATTTINVGPIPDRFALGVCYYPEHWPVDRWPVYARQMRELGLRYVRIAEFAWSRMEPVPGEYEWGWLDDAIASLAAEGLEVVLCTPTATPPAWLIERYPEILPVDAEGRTRKFGSRRHYDFASERYRTEAARITRAIGERYGQHPAVVGWQLDNEVGCHETGRSYGVASRDGFRRWLERRYGTLDALNEAWGNVFWSQEYTAWSQIETPNLTVAETNPSHLLDFCRFSSDLVVDFLRDQVDVLRPLSPGRWITHNFMRFFDEFDHYAASEFLDFACWDAYQTGAVELSAFDEASKRRWIRTGHPDLSGFNHDLYRTMSRNRAFWVIEGQVGQINWASYNPLPATGAVALWATQTYAHGGACYSVFRWRAATMAQEIMHSGLLRHDESFDRGADELRELPVSGAPMDAPKPRIALVHDYETLWIQGAQQHAAGASYWEQVLLYYGVLRGLGQEVDIVHPDADLSGYALVVAPALQIVNTERAARLSTAAQTARLVFGPRAGFRTATGRVPGDGAPGPLRPLVGWSLRNFDGLMPGMYLNAGGHRVENWAECYQPLDRSTVLARYDDGPMKGEAAVVRNGSTTTIGAWSASLIEQILIEILTELDLDPVRLPEGVRRNRTAGGTLWQNWNQEPTVLPDGTELGPVASILRA